MNSAELNRSLARKAQNIGQRRVQNIHANLAEILQGAAADGAVEITDDSVRISARRLFTRMMGNEKLRSPQSFLEV